MNGLAPPEIKPRRSTHFWPRSLHMCKKQTIVSFKREILIYKTYKLDNWHIYSSKKRKRKRGDTPLESYSIPKPIGIFTSRPSNSGGGMGEGESSWGTWVGEGTQPGHREQAEDYLPPWCSTMGCRTVPLLATGSSAEDSGQATGSLQCCRLACISSALPPTPPVQASSRAPISFPDFCFCAQCSECKTERREAGRKFQSGELQKMY